MVRRRASRALALVAAVVGALILVPALIPGLGSLNPFKTETEDRSGPVLLKSLEKLSEYRASTARMQVPVEVREDVGVLPDFIAGKKTLLIASGTVDAGVSFLLRLTARGRRRISDAPDRDRVYAQWSVRPNRN